MNTECRHCVVLPQVLITVTASASAAEKVKAAVQKVKDKAQAIVDEISHEKAIATVKLEAARPALEEVTRSIYSVNSTQYIYWQQESQKSFTFVPTSSQGIITIDAL